MARLFTTRHKTKRIIEMAKEKDKTGKVEFGNIVWCIDNLDTKQLESHDKKPYASDDILGKAHEMIEDGFKISLKFDGYSKSFLVSAVCDDKSFNNAGLAISARSNDISDAFSIMLYKYYNVAKRDLRPFADKIPTGVRG